MIKVSKRFGFISFLFIAVFMLIGSFAFGKNATKTPEEILTAVDKYQTKYFEIVKRNDYFLHLENYDTYKIDKKDLKKIYSEVKKQIKDKEDLKEYKAIEKRYAVCEEETTAGMNEFVHNNYMEVDALLNKVYNKVKAKISPEDFQNLVLSEKKWLKEVDDYKTVFDSMGYGTIGTLVYYTYQIDMRKFRTLLLMLYL